MNMPTPIKRAYRSFRYLFEREPWVFEVIFGFSTALFFWLLWADWQAGPMFGSIRILSEVRSEDFWQWSGIICGFCQFIFALAADSEVRWMKFPRWLAALCLASIWGSMACSSWVALPWTPSAALYAGCIAANIYVGFHVLWEDEYRRVRRLEA